MKRRVIDWSPGKGFQHMRGRKDLVAWFRYGNTTTRFVIVTWPKTNMLAWDGTPWTDSDALELWTVDVPTHHEDGYCWVLKDKCQRVTHLEIYPELGVIVKREPIPAELVRAQARLDALEERQGPRQRRKKRREWMRNG